MKLSKEAQKLKNDYAKQWRLKNPGKGHKYLINYWERQAKEQFVINPEAVTLNPEAVTLNPEAVTLNPEAVTLNHEAINQKVILKCENCYISFNAKRIDAKFCSPACRQSYHRR